MICHYEIDVGSFVFCEDVLAHANKENRPGKRQIFSVFQSAFILKKKPTRKIRVGKSRIQFIKKKIKCCSVGWDRGTKSCI